MPKAFNVLILLSAVFIFGCETSENPLKIGFVQLTGSQTGIGFSNQLTESEYLNIITYEYFYNGGGVSAGDINNDGLADLYFTANQEKNKLYLNKGNFQFEDITESASVAGMATWTNGVTMADVNGDGFLDIYVCNSGRGNTESDRRNELFINNGNLTFTERGVEFGLGDASYSTQAIFLDIDKDNDLDMFLLNRPTDTYKPEEALMRRATVHEMGGDKLFRNDNGKFIDISKVAGIIQNGMGYGLGVAAGDLNNDGWPDLYVTNDYIEPDYMYINNGNGTFSEVGRIATQHMSNFGMGVDISDVNNDGFADVFVADMAPADNYRQKTMMKPMNPEQFYWAVSNGFHHQYMYNTLQINNGDMTFSDAAQLAGMATTDWSWATLFGDVDNDGWSDLLITNGFRKEFSNKDFVKKMDKGMGEAMNKSLEDRVSLMNELLQEIPETKISNFIFQNQGDLHFENRSSDWGLSEPTFSNGATMADLDNDGDLDLVINNIDQEALVYRNDLGNSNSIRVKLIGPKGNSSGLGAKLVMSSNGKNQYREHFLTRGYQSSIEDVVHFGLGKEEADSLVVIWPDGKRQVIKELSPFMTLSYENSSELLSNERPAAKKMFSNVTDEVSVSAEHSENIHIDFITEVLLPHQMSRFGPALAVGDFDQNGMDDFFMGGASGMGGKLFLQNTEGKFKESVQPLLLQDSFFEDVGAALFDADSDGDLDIYVSSGGNEWLPNSSFYQDRLYINNNGILERGVLPKITTSNGVVRPFDIDGDGDLDLFVAGRLSPLQYPVPSKSWILKNNGGRFEDVTSSYNVEFEKLGLITDAKWTDFNGDGQVELVVVGEWTPVRVFELTSDKLIEKTTEWGLSNLTGWWYSVEIGDLNGDGRMDMVLGNLGQNYKYKASEAEPFHVYYNDFDKNGRGDIVLGYYNNGDLFPLRGRQCSSEQIPSIAEKFKTYDQFGKATLEEVYGQEKLEKSYHFKANTFASTLLLNEGTSFEQHLLPSMAQLSSINGIIIEDFNKDSVKDILYAGNLYPVEIETPRNDASFGGLLLGNGEGDFVFQGSAVTGFNAGGDVKNLVSIRLANNKKGVLVVRNSGKLEVFKVN